MSAASDAGTVPVIALVPRFLRSPPPTAVTPTWRTAHATGGVGGYIGAQLYIVAGLRGYKSGSNTNNLAISRDAINSPL